jgi:hypothetical protein
MEKVIRYKANDGSEWDSAGPCEARDEMIREVDAAMKLLKPTPNDCNWKGYVQQSEAAVTQCKELLYAIANREGVLKWWIDGQKREHGKTDSDFIYRVHASWFGRMLDGGHEPLGSAYGRLCSIDDKFREWNQPYYASHPEQGEMICVG